MKKKIVFALLLAGMSFATPSKVEAQEKVVQTQQTAKVLAGPIDCRGYCVVDYQGCALTAAGMCACPPKGCI